MAILKTNTSDRQSAAQLLEMKPVEVSQLLQRRQLVASVGVIVATLLFVAFGGSWVWRKIQESLTTTKRQRQELQQITQRAALVSTLSPDDRANFLRAEQALPPAKEPLVILQALTDVAREAGVSVGQFDSSPGVVSTTSAVQNRSRTSRNAAGSSFQIEVEMTGTFEQIKDALQDIETALPLMEVTEMSITPSERGLVSTSSAVTYATLMQVTSYFLPQPQPTGRATELTRVQQETVSRLQQMQDRINPEFRLPPQQFDNPDFFFTVAPSPEPVATPTPTPEELIQPEL